MQLLLRAEAVVVVMVMIAIKIWWFPEIGVPAVIIHFNGMFRYKPTIWGYPHDYGKPHMLVYSWL